MPSFGSTQKEELPDAGMVIAKQVRDKTATIQGISAELQIQKQQIKHLQETLEHTTRLVQTFQGQLDAMQRNYAIALQDKFRGGTTQVD